MQAVCATPERRDKYFRADFVAPSHGERASTSLSGHNATQPGLPAREDREYGGCSRPPPVREPWLLEQIHLDTTSHHAPADDDRLSLLAREPTPATYVAYLARIH